MQAGVGVLRLAIERTDRSGVSGDQRDLGRIRMACAQSSRLIELRRKRGLAIFRAPNRESRHRRRP